MKKIFILGIVAVIGWGNDVFAQEKGVLSGSIGSNNQIYRDDNKIGAKAPNDRFGSNNYLQLDYAYGNFKAGLQYEAYLPPLLGYDFQLEDEGVVHKYVRYDDKQLSVTVGNFYEQFGSGILFRAWEDRQLGINNALEGVSIRFRPLSYLQLKGVIGKQRKYFDTGKGRIRGIDGEINLLEALQGEHRAQLLIGGGYINRYQDYTGPVENYPKSVDAFSGRINFGLENNNLQLEYVRKGKDGFVGSSDIVDHGSALLINNTYTRKGIGVNLSFRRLENMNFRSEREAVNNELFVNYLPANTKQHKYSLANIYPYSTQSNGEIGGQVDIFYTIRKKTALGGKYGTRLAFNYSMYNQLAGERSLYGYYLNSDFLSLEGTKLYRDFNFELRKKWSKHFKTNLAFINLEYNKSVLEGGGKGLVKAKIYVADLQWKLKKGNAIKTEFQYLNTRQDMGDWTAASLDYSIGSHWSFFVSDMYNNGKTDVHYLNFGGSYVNHSTRFMLSYGRQREGLLCVGGVCRMVPAASGVSFSLSKSF